MISFNLNFSYITVYLFNIFYIFYYMNNLIHISKIINKKKILTY